MNLPTIIVLALVVILAGLALYHVISSRKKGKSCCDGCNGCIDGTGCKK